MMKKNSTPRQKRTTKKAVSSRRTTEDENLEAANRVQAFLDIDEPLPPFLRDCVIEAINEAAKRSGAPEPDVDPKYGCDLEGLVYLFEVAWNIDLHLPDFHVTPRQKLVAHLSAVLTHPETPAALYNTISDEISSWSGDYLTAVVDTPAFIESCLEYYQRKEAKRTKGGEHNA